MEEARWCNKRCSKQGVEGRGLREMSAPDGEGAATKGAQSRILEAGRLR